MTRARTYAVAGLIAAMLGVGVLTLHHHASGRATEPGTRTALEAEAAAPAPSVEALLHRELGRAERGLLLGAQARRPRVLTIPRMSDDRSYSCEITRGSRCQTAVPRTLYTTELSAATAVRAPASSAP